MNRADKVTMICNKMSEFIALLEYQLKDNMMGYPEDELGVILTEVVALKHMLVILNHSVRRMNQPG